MQQNTYINYYQLLGVEPNASNEQILNAFKEKAKEYHPDKNEGHHTATILFQYIQQAKEILTDSQKRLEYDILAGIKERPAPTQQIVHVSPKKTSAETLIAVGAIGLLIGIFIGGSDSNNK